MQQKSADTPPISARKVLKVTFIALLTIATVAAVGLWKWGKEMNYWGTPSALQTLLAEKLAQPESLGLHVESYTFTGNVQLFGKTPPYEVKYVIVDDRQKTSLQSLQRAALENGWEIDPNCDSQRLWCANKTVSGEATRRMTINPKAETNDQTHSFPFEVRISYY